MNNMLAVLTGTLMSAVWFMPGASADTLTACVTQNMAVPAGANASDKAAPFFIDTTGLDFKTAPPTRDPSNPNYPHATELPDGTLPPSGAEGNFIIGPTHEPAPETSSKEGVPRGATTSFTLSSNDSVILTLPGPTLSLTPTVSCSRGPQHRSLSTNSTRTGGRPASAAGNSRTAFGCKPFGMVV